MLVNNAGLTRDNLLLRLKDDDWDAVVDANLRGAFATTRAATRGMMKRRWGRIVNIASIAGIHSAVNGPHYVGYAASKAGLMGLTRELAATWGRKGIRVNAIAPGPFESKMMAATLAAHGDEIAASSPLGRIGRPDDMAGVAVYLASRAGAYVTGAVIPVDGGRATTL